MANVKIFEEPVICTSTTVGIVSIDMNLTSGRKYDIIQYFYDRPYGESGILSYMVAMPNGTTGKICQAKVVQPKKLNSREVRAMSDYMKHISGTPMANVYANKKKVIYKETSYLVAEVKALGYTVFIIQNPNGPLYANFKYNYQVTAITERLFYEVCQDAVSAYLREISKKK